VVDRPLLCQLAGSDAAAVVVAGWRLQSAADGVDVSFGCPQRREGGYGAAFLEGRLDQACAVVAALAEGLGVSPLRFVERAAACLFDVLNY
jgi:tRNA-dihydrouridine synthase